MINILEKQLIWNTLRFHIPMLICATWVIIIQRKVISDTLKRWWGWGWRNWTKERKDYIMMWILGAVTFVFTIFVTRKVREELVIKQRQEAVEKMLEEKVITPQELQKAQEKEKQEQEFRNKKSPLPLYDISPFLCFVLVCLIAPLGEECVFRYIIFEIFDKKNPLAYLLSGGSFIFLHWLGPTQGLLNFTTFKLLLLTYLPFTAFLIYVYRKSNWNITYPIYFHFLWNLLNFSLVAAF